MPSDLQALEAKQGRCPKGHLLPHRTNRGRCTPVYCMGSTSGGKVSKQEQSDPEQLETSDLGDAPATSSSVPNVQREALYEVSRQADSVIDAMIDGSTVAGQQARAVAKRQKGEALQKLAHDIGRYSAFRTLFKVPEGLEGAAAEEFVRKKADMLSVDMIVDLERDMKLGDDTQRREARRDLADMLGIRKREASPQARSTIVIIGNSVQNGRIVPPWKDPAGLLGAESRGSSSSAVVDGTSIEVHDDVSSGPKGPPGPKGDS